MADAPKIQTPNITAMDQQMLPLVFVGNEYPDGIDVLLIPPGGLKPIGTQRIPRGYLVVVFPPGPVTNQLVAMAIEAARKMANADGAVRAPGFKA